MVAWANQQQLQDNYTKAEEEFVPVYIYVCVCVYVSSFLCGLIDVFYFFLFKTIFLPLLDSDNVDIDRKQGAREREVPSWNWSVEVIGCTSQPLGHQVVPWCIVTTKWHQRVQSQWKPNNISI